MVFLQVMAGGVSASCSVSVSGSASAGTSHGAPLMTSSSVSCPVMEHNLRWSTCQDNCRVFGQHRVDSSACAQRDGLR